MGDATAGKSTYDKSCASCHGTGVAGAPKLGDKAAWAPRIATGNDAIMQIVMKGKGAMPPRGGCANCSDDDLKNVVAYMLKQAK
ncbi:MAG: cytochrome c5 family protein [Gammaproteobacteria bacterium]|nr:cytochrome c5 family protein [Gammaproteobacteria bacterium]